MTTLIKLLIGITSIYSCSLYAVFFDCFKSPSSNDKEVRLFIESSILSTLEKFLTVNYFQHGRHSTETLATFKENLVKKLTGELVLPLRKDASKKKSDISEGQRRARIGTIIRQAGQEYCKYRPTFDKLSAAPSYSHYSQGWEVAKMLETSILTDEYWKQAATAMSRQIDEEGDFIQGLRAYFPGEGQEKIGLVVDDLRYIYPLIVQEFYNTANPVHEYAVEHFPEIKPSYAGIQAAISQIDLNKGASAQAKALPLKQMPVEGEPPPDYRENDTRF